MTSDAQKHDETHDMLQQWLRSENAWNLRAPGVKDNLFRLSDYVSGKTAVPDKETLTFLHAYIFALESYHASASKELRELRKRPSVRVIEKRIPSRIRPLIPRPPRAASPENKEL